MTKFRNAFIAFAIASTSVLGVSTASSGPMPKAPLAHATSLKIVAFGSSSTQGIGASTPAAAYPAQLETVLHTMMPQGSVTVVNRGIGGEDADDMAKRLQKDVIARHPDIVIFQTGSNDPMRHVPLARFERETREGIAAMQTAGITVILMEPQWCPTLDKIAAAVEYRDVLRKIGAELNLIVIRRSDMMHDWIKTGVLTKREMLAPDGLHMRDQGYALLARWVALEITKTDAYKAKSRTSDAVEAKLEGGR